jgi:hypothetical protein
MRGPQFGRTRITAPGCPKRLLVAAEWVTARARSCPFGASATGTWLARRHLIRGSPRPMPGRPVPCASTPGRHALGHSIGSVSSGPVRLSVSPTWLPVLPRTATLNEVEPDLRDAQPPPSRPNGVHRRCPECRGVARLPGMVKTTGMGKGMGSVFGPCPTCDGVGYLAEDDLTD